MAKLTIFGIGQGKKKICDAAYDRRTGVIYFSTHSLCDAVTAEDSFVVAGEFFVPLDVVRSRHPQNAPFFDAVRDMVVEMIESGRLPPERTDVDYSRPAVLYGTTFEPRHN